MIVIPEFAAFSSPLQKMEHPFQVFSVILDLSNDGNEGETLYYLPPGSFLYC